MSAGFGGCVKAADFIRHQFRVASGKEVRLKLTLDNGENRRRINLYVRRGENLLDALSRLDGLKVEKHEKYGLWITSADGKGSSEKSGWHFFINNAIPYSYIGGRQLYLSLYHINAVRSMSIRLELVSNCADFENSVIDPLLDYKTNAFLLESINSKNREAFKLIDRLSISASNSCAKQAGLFWFLHSRMRMGELSSAYRFERFGAPSQNAGAPIQRSFACAQAPMQLPAAVSSGSQQGYFLAEPLSAEASAGGKAPSGHSGNAPSEGSKETMHLDSSRAVFQKTENMPVPGGKPIRAVPLSSLKKFRAVIFDLDGVVVDSERAHLVTFNKAFAPLGAKISESRWRRHYTGVGSFAIVEDLFKRNGINANVCDWVGKRASVYQRHVEKHGLPAISGFKGFHSLLIKNGLKVAVGSGGHKPHIAASLKSIGLANTPFIGLEDVKNAKPAPDTFLKAASLVGAQPDECVVVEDSLSGLRAAAAAGMPAIALTTTLPRRELLGKAAIIVPDFRSIRLKRLIRKLLLGRGKGKQVAGKSAKGRRLRGKRQGKEGKPGSPRNRSRGRKAAIF
ncbi:MAG: HAD-IA family hydrolase [Candidatus Micrarchaeia archaeon]